MRFQLLMLVLALGLSALFTSPPSVGQDAPSTPTQDSTVRQLGDPKPFPFRFEFPRTPVAELKARRAAVAQEVGNGSVILISTEPPELSSGGRYKPDHDVFYFTGVDTDFCALVLHCKNGALKETKLFLPKYDKSYELWNGRRAVAGDEAKELTGIDDIVTVKSGGIGGDSLKALEEELRSIAERTDGPVYLNGGGAARTRAGLDLTPLRRSDRAREFLKSVRSDIAISGIGSVTDSQRSIKSAHEVALVRRAVEITGEGFVRALRHARPGMWEFEFEALMQQAFIEFGSTGLPYYPIAGSGPNACVLHYTANRRQFEDGDVVLCDIAAEFGYYAADITRTFPANGKFTPRQKLVYEAVLAGQSAAAAALRPGATMFSIDKVCRAAMLAAGLKASELYPHGLGHHVGLDVHDPGPMNFKPGMILTIEPGSYLKSESLGVRIEDCYLVTEAGSECLSQSIPRTVAEIESIVGSATRGR